MTEQATTLGGVDTRWLFVGLVALFGLERLLHLVIARRNTARLRARGAVELGAGHYPVMVVLHAAFLVAAPLEVVALERAFHWPLALVCGLALAAAVGLRYWAIAALGERWTTRVLCLPGAPLVRSGPYRFLRHPNYAAVIIEILVLPLVHSAWWTALVFSLANAALLAVRIRVEEEGLRRLSGGEARPAAAPGGGR